jgi:hypothetical protein
VPDEEISLCFGLVARMSIGLRDRVFCSGVVVERNDAGKKLLVVMTEVFVVFGALF